MGVNIRLISRHGNAIEIVLALSNNVASSLRYPEANAGAMFIGVVPRVTWLRNLIVPVWRGGGRLVLN
jgi:hypothetical protein